MTEGAVRKAVKTGRIDPHAVSEYRTKTGKTRREITDPVLAADSFRRNTDHTRASTDRPLEAGVADDIAKLRLIRERAKAQVDVAKARKAVGESIGRYDARQGATSVVHAALNNLRATVRAKRLTKDELLAAIDACEIAIMDGIEQRFSPNNDES
jgi:hypothetical protein